MAESFIQDQMNAAQLIIDTLCQIDKNPLILNAAPVENQSGQEQEIMLKSLFSRRRGHDLAKQTGRFNLLYCVNDQSVGS